jgi:hypothetical protein
MMLTHLLINKLYSLYKKKTKPTHLQVDVPNTCSSWRERTQSLSVTRKFLEQNIKIVKNE